LLDPAAVSASSGSFSSRPQPKVTKARQLTVKERENEQARIVMLGT